MFIALILALLAFALLFVAACLSCFYLKRQLDRMYADYHGQYSERLSQQRQNAEARLKLAKMEADRDHWKNCYENTAGAVADEAARANRLAEQLEQDRASFVWLLDCLGKKLGKDYADATANLREIRGTYAATQSEVHETLPDSHC